MHTHKNRNTMIVHLFYFMIRWNEKKKDTEDKNNNVDLCLVY